jgi:uncharacterized membrane protein YeaQ/YmgE (transglycosylase-associated protein family)
MIEHMLLIHFSCVFLITILAGAAKYFHLTGERTFFRECVKGLFSAVVAALLCSYLKIEPPLSYLFVAIAAFMGSEFILVVAKRIRRFVIDE